MDNDNITLDDVDDNQHEIQPVQQQSTSSRTPSPDAVDGSSDLKLSRKREREVSLEPATSKTAIQDADAEAVLAESKESRTPAKKNRVYLDATEEEGEEGQQQARHSHSHSHPQLELRRPSHLNSPPLSTSPPHEIKVRQISQGVEDISWKNKLKAAAAEKESDIYEQDEIVLDVDNTGDEAVTTEDIGVAQVSTETVGGEMNDSQSLSVHSLVIPMAARADAEPPEETPSNGVHERSSSSRRGSESDSGEQEKKLKRKLADRAASQGPQDVGPHPSGVESQKRARDDAGTGGDVQEANRRTPPREASIDVKMASSPAPKFGGFMAYASSSSPFAAVKGQNIFSNNFTSTPSKVRSKAPSASSFLPSAFSSGESSTSTISKESHLAHANNIVPTPSLTSTATKRTGFEAFASSASPFAAAARSKSPNALHRSKSPPRRAGSVSAFSSYATGGVQGFVIPAPKRVRAESPSGGSSQSSLERSGTTGLGHPSGGGGGFGLEADTRSDVDDEEGSDRPVSFGEKLRAGRDDEDEVRSEDEQTKLSLIEQETHTGEEDEETIHQVRGKLFSLSPQNQWKERGTGTLRLNVRRSDGEGARLVMRKEAVYTVILNVTLFQGMKCFIAQDPRYIRLSVIEGGTTTHYNLRVPNPKIASDLLEEINNNIPSA